MDNAFWLKPRTAEELKHEIETQYEFYLASNEIVRHAEATGRYVDLDAETALKLAVVLLSKQNTDFLDRLLEFSRLSKPQPFILQKPESDDHAQDSSRSTSENGAPLPAEE